MVDEADKPEQPRWLVEPPAPHEMHLYIETGDRVEITPEIQAALEQFLLLVRGGDVRGFAADPKCTDKFYSCTPEAKCEWETQRPCFADYHCRIASLG